MKAEKLKLKMSSSLESGELRPSSPSEKEEEKEEATPSLSSSSSSCEGMLVMHCMCMDEYF